MRPTIAALRSACGPFVPLVAAIALAGCSASGKISGPSWNLTGGKGAAPIPERPINPNPPQAAGLPAAERQQPVYRGGRDPVSGRAPGWGSPPSGFETRPLAQPTQPLRPSAAPIYTPTYAPSAANQPAIPGARVIEVRPGQSLASIAVEQKVSIASLMQVNRLRDAYVIPGQQLVIPPR